MTTTEDLVWLVKQGLSNLSAAELASNQLRAQKASRAAQGKEFAEAELTNAEKIWLPCAPKWPLLRQRRHGAQRRQFPADVYQGGQCLYSTWLN
jgi:hypothetical protein